MLEGFTDAMDAPWVETIGGIQITFPILDLDDLAAIARTLADGQKVKALKALPMSATQEQKDAVIRFYNGRGADVDTLTGQVFDLQGAATFALRSLEKAGLSAADRKRVVDTFRRQHGARALSKLAERVSGLFPPEQEAKAETTDPNPPAGESPAATSGSSGASSSGSAAGQQAA